MATLFKAPCMLPLAGAALALTAQPALLHLDDHTAEPPSRFVLTIGKETHALQAGEAVELTIDGKKHTVLVSESDTRVLQAAGLKFEYPRGMSFEYEDDPFVDIWTLDGNDAVVMIFDFPVGMGLEEFVEQQAEGYGALGEVEESSAKITLEGKSVKGSRLTVDAEAFGLAVEIFPGEPGDESSRWIVLQDSLDEGEGSEEFEQVKALMSETLERVR